MSREEKDRGELKSVAPKNIVTNVTPSKPTPPLDRVLKEGEEPRKPKHISEVEESSMFSGIVENNDKAEKMQKKIEKQYAVVPKQQIVKEEDIIEDEEQVAAPIEEPMVCKVYEVTCMTINMAGQKKEAIVYSYHVPTIVQDTPSLMVIQAPFGKHNFREVVFGKKQIEVSCREEVEDQQLVADLTNGILVKFIPEEDWMNRDYEETKDLFEKTVLNAYRSISQTITPVAKQPKGPIQKNNNSKKPNIVYHNGDPGSDEFQEIGLRPGNLPVNRGQIWPQMPGEGMEIIPDRH